MCVRVLRSLPDEFCCPITLCKFIEPVVASDGHTYEQSAIQAVIKTRAKRSPMTREKLAIALHPNTTLKKRSKRFSECGLNIPSAHHLNVCP